jgi:hypothetical protein
VLHGRRGPVHFPIAVRGDADADLPLDSDDDLHGSEVPDVTAAPAPKRIRSSACSSGASSTRSGTGKSTLLAPLEESSLGINQY